MKRYTYRERDYAFAQLMLTLRATIGLTQAGLGELLGVSRRAVAEWEGGLSYPKAERLKQLITLGVQQQAFASGREEQEIRALWKAAHQKVLLDEQWLHGLLGAQRLRLVPVAPLSDEQTRVTDQAVPRPALRPRVDWGEALDVPSFYGREEELVLLSRWLVEERCQAVSVLGMGGIGKSALATRVMHQVARQFEVVIWRSLRDAPACEELLDSCLQVLAPQALRDLPERLRLLMEQLRARRVLLVLDNLEMLLEEGEGTGRVRAGAEGYVRLLRQIGETAHQSCLLLTSREKPADLVPLEGKRSPVRALRLAGLDAEAGTQLLEAKDVAGTAHDRKRLVEVYRGNPLALKIVAQTIVELFGGEIAPFLEQGEVVFGGVRELLDEQFARLSVLEQSVLLWLAILREPVSLEELLAAFNIPRKPVLVLEALGRLGRRSMIERGQWAGSFTLQSVVLEYVTALLIDVASREIEQGKLLRLIEHGLCQAQAKVYVRETQERLIVAPILTRLQSTFRGHDEVEEYLLGLLDPLRGRNQATQGYGPANLVVLLRMLRGDLRGLDLSRLALRSLYLQGVEMQDTSLEGAHLEQVVFSQAFGAIFSVAMSPDGQYWAAGSISGEVRIWREEGQTAYAVIPAHTHAVAGVAFSPDGSMLASGSWDCTVKLWDVAGKTLVWNFQGHQGYVQSVAFRPGGGLLASGSDDGSVKLWDLRTGRCLHTLRGHHENVYAIAWHPHGHLLASGSFDRTIRIWDVERATCLRTLTGHTNWVMGLAFTPDGKLLASGGADNLVKVWEVESGRSQHNLAGHTDHVRTVAWSPDGQTLASGSFDTTIGVWQPDREMTRQTLLGHTDLVQTLVFTPDGKWLLSGSEDRTLRVWEISSGQCLRILQGYSVTPLAVTWSPDSRLLATGGTYFAITIWDRASRRPVKSLQGHTQPVYTLAWHPKGSLIASGSYDHSVRIWDSTTGNLVQLFSEHTSQVTRVAWSPDGAWLASAGYDQVVRVWDISKSTCRWVGHGHTSLVSAVSWSPDGTRLATCSDDHTVRLWQTEDGTLLQTLQGHSKDVASVVWSPDGRVLASCGGGGSTGELFLWDARSGELLRSLGGHPSHVFAIAWSPQGDILVSADIDGTLRWWNVESGVCVYVRQGHQGWINSIAISLNGEMLASCGHDGLTHLWEMSSAEHLATLRADRPYERLSLVHVTGLTEAQKTTLRALGALEEASV